MNESTVNAWCIINDKVEKKTFPLSELRFNKNQEMYWVYDYGMGAVHWSVINKPEEAYHRQWAEKHSPQELDSLNDIIDSNGFTRLSRTLKKLKCLSTLEKNYSK